jgi:MFS family permease
VAIGFLLAYLAFTGAFMVMFALSAVLLLVVLTEKSISNASTRVDGNLVKRIFKNRPKTFWHAAVLQVLVYLPYNMTTSFLIPLYLLSSLKLGYQETGIVLAVLSLATGAFAVLMMKLGIPNRTILLLSGLSAVALVIFPLVGQAGVWMVVPLAIGTGCGSIIAEYILVDQVYRSKNVSTDIGVLYVPLKTAEFLYLSLGGLVIARFGFAPLFFVLALSILLFVLFGRATIRDMHK